MRKASIRIAMVCWYAVVMVSCTHDTIILEYKLENTCTVQLRSRYYHADDVALYVQVKFASGESLTSGTVTYHDMDVPMAPYVKLNSVNNIVYMPEKYLSHRISAMVSCSTPLVYPPPGPQNDRYRLAVQQLFFELQTALDDEELELMPPIKE